MALWLFSAAYLAVGLGSGDEIITTVLLLPLPPVQFCLVLHRSLLMGPRLCSITAATIALITPRTKAISVVHLGGCLQYARHL